jgi:exopolysaccharide biosynthesis predicted pyruvyltransferase EpsI
MNNGNTSSKMSFQPLFDCLMNLPEFDYMPNGGNYGDSLIREGTETFFRMHFINYKLISFAQKPQATTNKILVFGGGGAWCKNFTHAPSIVAHALLSYERVIVLPSTYELDVSHKSRVTHFRRDDFGSLKHCPHSILCPDMAFVLRPNPVEIIHNVGNFFRKDEEKSGKIVIPKDNRDLSNEGNHLQPVSHFFNVIGRYKHIETDRLHVGIAAILLGRSLTWYGGNYPKIRDVYHTFFKDMPNIKFVD